MSLIVLPYMGPAAARRELTRPARPAAPAEAQAPEPQLRSDHDPLQGVHMRLTLRTARVLDGIADLPGASNRMVAEHAGVSDPGQISKLLARLERLELIENSSEGHTKGEPNAWSLTATGQQVAQSIRFHARHETRRRAA
jgi:DNA-binding MarR family transcriptional regulator